MPTEKPKTHSKGGAHRTVIHGRAHVRLSFNNSIVTITDPQGNTLTWATAGTSGFKNSRKKMSFPAQLAIERALSVAQEKFGMKTIEVIVKGLGPGRESLKAFVKPGLRVIKFYDVTPSAHNGPRRNKKRRV